MRAFVGLVTSLKKKVSLHFWNDGAGGFVFSPHSGLFQSPQNCYI